MDLLVKPLIVGTPPGVEPVMVGRLAQPDAVDLLVSIETDTTASVAAERVRTLRSRLATFYDAATKGEITPAALARIEARLLPQIAGAERLASPGHLSLARRQADHAAACFAVRA